MKKHGAARIVRLILLALALALLIFVMAFPFFYMFTSSFKQDTDVFTKSMFYIPIPPNWNNYVRVWTEINFLQYYLNTNERPCSYIPLNTIKLSVFIVNW